jgi:uncharacterized membrane protein YccC
MREEIERARRLLDRIEQDARALRALLERLEARAEVERDSGTQSARRGRKREEIPEDPAFWRQALEELLKDFQERGREAVQGFAERHTLRFLLAFMQVHHIPIPGKGRPSKAQIEEELYQRLRERRALEQPVFSSPPKSEKEAERPQGFEEPKAMES